MDLDSYTPAARRAHELAGQEALELKHHYIGSEHLLLGLLREEHGIAAKALDRLGVTPGRVRQLVVRILGEGEAEEPGGEPNTFPFTPNAVSVLRRRGATAARAAGSESIDTHHLLLGLLKIEASVAVRVLDDFGATPNQVRAEIERLQRANN